MTGSLFAAYNFVFLSTPGVNFRADCENFQQLKIKLKDVPVSIIDIMWLQQMIKLENIILII